MDPWSDYQTSVVTYRRVAMMIDAGHKSGQESTAKVRFARV